MPFLQNLFRDLKYALRVLSRNPGFSLVVVSTLALGIGTNTAIFSLVDATILHPLPYPDPDRLMALSEANRKGEDVMISWPDFEDWHQATSFRAIVAVGGVNLNLTGSGNPERLHGLRVSASFLSTLGVHPMLGRDFNDSDDKPGALPVAILSNELWVRRFGSDPRIVASNLHLDARTYSVIGVLGPGFRFPYSRDIYIPIGLDADKQPNRGVRSVARVIARLRPGISVRAAAAELARISRQLERTYPEFDDGIHATMRPFAELVVEPAERALLALSASVLFVLLIACANVTSLLLSRAKIRQREMATRLALGANRRRVISQLLTETGVLAFAGAIAGCAVAAAALPALSFLAPLAEGEMEQYVRPTLSWPVLIFTLGLALFTTLLVGVAPAMRMSGGAVAGQIGARAAIGGFKRLSFQNSLVAAQIAIAMVLLTASGLLLQSLLRLLNTNPGFQPEHLLTARLKLPSTQYGSVAQRSSFFLNLIDRIDAIPGVANASGATCLPFAGKDCWPSTFEIEGQPVTRAEDTPHVHFNAIAPGYLKTMQIPFISGRDFSEQDDVDHERVALVNERFVRQFFSHSDPIGRKIFEGYGKQKNAYRIVGVVGDARRDSPDSPPVAEVFLALPQVGPDAFELVIRSPLRNPALLAPEIIRATRQLDPDVPLYDVRTMKWYVDYQTADRRFPTFLLSIFAGVATLLAAIGLYGVISYLVSQRTKELGIRMALGAQTADIARMVMNQGLRLVTAGLLIGLCGAWATTRFIAALLFATHPNDPLTLATSCALFITVAAAACWLPAHRAAALDPAQSLRVDQ